MATAKKSLPPPRRATSAAVLKFSPAVGDTSGDIVENATGDKIIPAVDDEGEKVTVVVPKDFALTIDHHHQREYKAGVQEMLVEHAAHWFSRAQGVKVYGG